MAPSKTWIFILLGTVTESGTDLEKTYLSILCDIFVLAKSVLCWKDSLKLPITHMLVTQWQSLSHLVTGHRDAGPHDVNILTPGVLTVLTTIKPEYIYCSPLPDVASKKQLRS